MFLWYARYVYCHLNHSPWLPICPSCASPVCNYPTQLQHTNCKCQKSTALHERFNLSQCPCIKAVTPNAPWLSKCIDENPGPRCSIKRRLNPMQIVVIHHSPSHVQSYVSDPIYRQGLTTAVSGLATTSLLSPPCSNP